MLEMLGAIILQGCSEIITTLRLVGTSAVETATAYKVSIFAAKMSFSSVNSFHEYRAFSQGIWQTTLFGTGEAQALWESLLHKE